MKIKFVDYKVVETIFSPSERLMSIIDNLGHDDHDSLDDYLEFSPIFLEDDINNFLVHFRLNLLPEKASSFENDTEVESIFSVQFLARFQVDEAIDEKFKKSNFPKVNAPAIAYPFLRSFVNTYFTSAGYNPVLLPTYNFTKFKSND